MDAAAWVQADSIVPPMSISIVAGTPLQANTGNNPLTLESMLRMMEIPALRIMVSLNRSHHG